MCGAPGIGDRRLLSRRCGLVFGELGQLEVEALAGNRQHRHPQVGFGRVGQRRGPVARKRPDRARQAEHFLVERGGRSRLLVAWIACMKPTTAPLKSASGAGARRLGDARTRSTTGRTGLQEQHSHRETSISRVCETCRKYCEPARSNTITDDGCMKIIIFGATGMIGAGALIEALGDSRAERVLAVGRADGRAPREARGSGARGLLDYAALQPRWRRVSTPASLPRCHFGRHGRGVVSADHVDLTLAAARSMAGDEPGPGLLLRVRGGHR